MNKIKCILGFIVVAPLIASLSYAQGGYECGACHPEGVPITNCLASGCHDTYDNGNHHTTEPALGGMCTACHSPALVADYDEGNPSSSPPTVTTPTVQSCNNCHKGHANPVDGNGDPYPYPLYNTAILEHMDLQGHVANCTHCHDPQLPYPIRQCETCHTVETLHNITGHIEGGFWHDENGAWTEITSDDRCIACHGSPPDPAPDTMLYVSQDVGTYDTTYSQLVENDCRSCHGASTAERHHQTIGVDSHEIHQTYLRGPQLGEGDDSCPVCHGPGPWDPEHWADGSASLAATTVCDTCHSPGGAYDGVNDVVIGAKHNWQGASSAIYNQIGDALQAGKEDWCAGCHDGAPAYSRSPYQPPGPGAYAPNVMGDNVTYGYNVSGHGPQVICGDCHDLTVSHIDGEARTYSAAMDNYRHGYRLNEDMAVPRNGEIPPEAFRLCINCHVYADIIGPDSNFRDDVKGFQYHEKHLEDWLTEIASDSDFDGTGCSTGTCRDSAITCIICHNVHGSLTPAMIRHGELISTAGTSDKVPALDFQWYKADGSTPTSLIKESRYGSLVCGQTPDVSVNHVCAGCHVTGRLYYYRTPTPCRCDLVPDATVVPRGGTLGFDITVSNNTNEVQVFGFATYATKPGGGKYPPSGYLIGPVRVSLNPYGSKSAHRSHSIPGNVPLGTYTYYGVVGTPGAGLYHKCQFPFEVVEP